MMESWTNLVTVSFKRDLWPSLFFVTIWSIWLEKNQIKFNVKNPNLVQMKNNIKLRLGMYVIFENFK